MLAGATGLRRRIEPIDSDQGASVPLGFILELTDKLTPSNVTDSFCKATILDHVLDSQALHANPLVLAYYACAELVLVVSPPILDTSMDFGNLQTCLVPVFRALLFLDVPSLSFCQLLLIFGKIARITNALTSGEGNHRFDAKIKTNHGVDYGLGLNFLFNQDRDEVTVGAIFGHGDRARFGILWEGSMPVDIQGRVHFCQLQRGAIPLESIRGIGSRLAILLFLERGILGSFLKKVLEGPVQMPQGLLNRHRRNIAQPRVLLLEIWQHGSQVVVVELLTTFFIHRRAGIQAPIVDKADTAERLSKNDSLLFSRIEPILVCPLDLLAHCLFALSLFLDVLFHRYENFSIERAIVLLSRLFHLLQLMGRKPNSESFHVVFHVTIVTSHCTYVSCL